MKVAMATYDERAFIEAYKDAQMPAYPHEDFATFRRARLAALERAFGLPLSAGPADMRSKGLWMYFHTLVASLVVDEGPSGWLEAGLLERFIDEVDNAELDLRGSMARFSDAGRTFRMRRAALLVSLFRATWGKVDKVVTSEELLRDGFDDSTEPKITDYFDFM